MKKITMRFDNPAAAEKAAANVKRENKGLRTQIKEGFDHPSLGIMYYDLEITDHPPVGETAALITAMMSDLRDCANDPYGNQKPEWSPRLRRSLPPKFETRKAGVVVTTTFSRDTRRMNNGGRYEHYASYRPVPGGIARYTVTSYEDDTPELDRVFPLALSQEGLERAATLAAARVAAELSPPEGNLDDLRRLRRRVEDALRKTARPADIEAIAAMLGVKTE